MRGKIRDVQIRFLIYMIFPFDFKPLAVFD